MLWLLRCIKDIYLFPKERGYWEDPELDECVAACINQLLGTPTATRKLIAPMSVSDFSYSSDTSDTQEQLMDDITCSLSLVAL
jgi:hypothetical protein